MRAADILKALNFMPLNNEVGVNSETGEVVYTGDFIGDGVKVKGSCYVW